MGLSRVETFWPDSNALADSPHAHRGNLVMAVIGLLACTAPTLRALRIMPTEALREGR